MEGVVATLFVKCALAFYFFHHMQNRKNEIFIIWHVRTIIQKNLLFPKVRRMLLTHQIDLAQISSYLSNFVYVCQTNHLGTILFFTSRSFLDDSRFFQHKLLGL